jgi:branched-chain amino acid transport system permease protein
VTLGNYVGCTASWRSGLVLLTGVAGQTSFGQAAFVGLGAYTTAILARNRARRRGSTRRRPGAHARACAVLGSSRCGWRPLPSARDDRLGHQPLFLFGNLEILGGPHRSHRHSVDSICSASSCANERYFYFLIWGIALVALWATANLLDSRAGPRHPRAQRPARDGRSVRVDTARGSRSSYSSTQRCSPCVSGWLYAHLQRFVNPTPFASTRDRVPVHGGGRRRRQRLGRVIGATLITLTKQVLQDIAADAARPQRQLRGRRVRRADGDRSSARARRRLAVDRALLPQRAGRPFPRPTPSHRANGMAVAVRCSMSRRAQGVRRLVAVNDLDVRDLAGRDPRLIGPNGAGKSTMFNLISGALR